MKDELHDRFGTSMYEDAMEELCRLRQTGSVQDYRNKFERLLGPAGILTDKQEVSLFISGLKEALRANVKAHSPVSLSAAISLARIFERRSGSLPVEKRTSWNSKILVNSAVEGKEEKNHISQGVPIRRFTPAGIETKKGEWTLLPL